MQMRIFSALLTSAVLFFATGCQSSGDNVQYYTPHWNYQEYKRVAVLPAKTKDPRQHDAADIVTQRLTDALASSGQFEVMTREDLKETMDEQTWSQLNDVDPSTAIASGRLKGVQALVIPSITVREMSSDRSTASGGGGGYGHHGGGGGGGSIDFMVNSATVGASVRVIDAATGKILTSIAPKPVTRTSGSAVVPPSQSPEKLLAEAADMVAESLASGIVPIERPQQK